MILEIKLYNSKELLISSLKLNRTGKVLILYKSTECKKRNGKSSIWTSQSQCVTLSDNGNRLGPKIWERGDLFIVLPMSK